MDMLCSYSKSLVSSVGLLFLVVSHCSATDQFNFYFDSVTADAGLLGGAAFTDSGDFYLIGFGSSQKIRRLEETGGSWSGTDQVVTGELALFYRADDLPAGNANNLWGGQVGGSANALLLNPAPLEISVPTGSGGSQLVTYPAGSLAFIADSVGVPSDLNSNQRPEVAKKLFRYDLREVLTSTSAQPDFNTARPFDGGPVIGSFGVADWNDVFQPVVSEQDLRNQSGASGSDSFGRQFAWSTDGQAIYAVDSGSAQGGIYRIDPTRHANSSTGITRILDDGESNSETNEASIRSEPAVVHTSVFDYASSNPAVGDQIIVEGSFNSGNSGGVNVFVDDGSQTLVAPTTLFTEAEFRSFADYYAGSRPRYVSIADDAAGNLYMYEQQTDVVFRYDTEGRFIKIATEREHNLFQQANGGDAVIARNNDDMSNMSIRISSEPGFDVTEVVYVDSELNAPVGVLVYQPGDFDRDNDTDADDLALFAAALGTRNSPVDDAMVKFDLNGAEVAFRAIDDEGQPVIRHRTNEQGVVDWKDVKILQQFVDIPNGDANFDGLLDFADLDLMQANYYTLGGGATKTWNEGDFASIDPEYIFDAVDANLVNEVDLEVLADAWVTDLGQMPVTEAEADAQGYTGQFKIDLLAAFAGIGGLLGDYNNNGVVDAADYTVWRDQLGESGADLAADGDGDGQVTTADYAIWRNNFGLRSGPIIPGDYNTDGVVDAADYTIWRDQLGESGADLAADGDGDGQVTTSDYSIWRSNFGQSNSVISLQVAQVPEPASVGVLLVLSVAVYFASIHQVTSRR